MAANSQKAFVKGRERFQAVSDTGAEWPIATPGFLGLSPGRVAKIQETNRSLRLDLDRRDRVPGSRIDEADELEKTRTV